MMKVIYSVIVPVPTLTNQYFNACCQVSARLGVSQRGGGRGGGGAACFETFGFGFAEDGEVKSNHMLCLSLEFSAVFECINAVFDQT